MHSAVIVLSTLSLLSFSIAPICFWLNLLQADDELENPILAGFEWNKEESWTRLIVHQKKEGAPVSKKSKKKAGEE